MELYGQATKAQEGTIIGQEKEQIEIAYTSVAINKLSDDVLASDLQEELDKVAKTKVESNEDGTLNVLFITTEHNYNVENGKVAKVEEKLPVANPYDENGWVMAWTCTAGEWSDTITAGNPAEGNIVAKLYATENTISEIPSVNYDIDYTFAPGTEYHLVIEGQGEMGPLMKSDDGNQIDGAYGWQYLSLAYMYAYRINPDNPSISCIMPYVTEITICEGITTIGEGAFAGDTSLKKVTIADSVKNIGWGAFFQCKSLANITIPNGVTNIEMVAFNTCTNLTNVTIPNSVTNIGENVFYNCTSLKSITYKGTIEKWNNIILNANWLRGSYLTNIVCTDGKIDF